MFSRVYARAPSPETGSASIESARLDRRLSMNRTQSILEAHHVRVVYPAAGRSGGVGPVEALRGVSLVVGEAETVALVGESGSGKSTLMKLFNRLVGPTEGIVRVRGEDVSTQDPIRLRRHIGYIQQEGGLLPHWTIARNIDLVPTLLGWDPDRRRAKRREWLQLVGLPDPGFENRFPRELSGGQRQRVAIARALAADPDIVLLDEPFGALDPITRADLQQEFIRLRSSMEKTMLLVTHDIEEAFMLAHRVAVMREGSIHQVDAPSVLREAPATDYVRRLLDRTVKTAGSGEEREERC